jgi:hypothetical protein
MLVGLVEIDSQSGFASTMSDAFIAAAISSELPPGLQLQPDVE